MDENSLTVFEVRNDIDRGNLVLTISLEGMSHNVHFFKHHHQPINQHPEQIQRIVRQAKPTTRTKSVKVNITSFLPIYWNVSGKHFEFKGVKLNCTEYQLFKVQETRINKEIGAIKRKKTIEASSKNKIQSIREKMEIDEEKFQLERAKRIKAAKADLMDLMDTDTTKATTEWLISV